MGTMILRNVEYVGDNYYYMSPDLLDGLNIVEGPNGSGKSTFTDLIYFALGGTVARFTENEVDFHKEIVGDTNNYVKVAVEIDEARYLLVRHFTKSEVMVIGDDESVSVFPVFRSGESVTISDWFLVRLGIEVFELYQGSYHGKINFTDLLRLMYYDQKTTPSKIFKDVDNNSFVTNSVEFKRAIFEILIGGGFQEYYSLYAQLKEAQRQLDSERSALRQFVDFLAELDIGKIDKNNQAVLKELRELSLQYDKLINFRKAIADRNIAEQNIEGQYQELNTELTEARGRLDGITAERSAIARRLVQLGESRAFVDDEVRKITKLIHAHESLGIFAPNICPICLREIDRDEGHCICGSPIDENEYEKFFYNSEEYKELLKQKQQNLRAVVESQAIVQEQLADLDKQVASARTEESQVRSKISKFVESARNGSVESEISNISEKAYSLREKMLNLQNYAQFEAKRQAKEDAVSTLVGKVERLEGKVSGALLKAQALLDSNIELFTKAYEAMMTNAVDTCRSVRLTSQYMPVINNGESMPASFDVQKRFLYFVSLLRLRNEKTDIAFPGFMIFDTPENLGIDLPNLNILISELNAAISAVGTTSQVILTTGVKKYPAEITDRVRIVLAKEARLLTAKPRSGAPILEASN